MYNLIYVKIWVVIESLYSYYRFIKLVIRMYNEKWKIFYLKVNGV